MAALKKLLLFTLVICTLGYSSAWAYDGEILEVNSQLSTTVDMVVASADNQLANDSDTEQAAATTVCAQCTHIFSHLQAIFVQSDFTCSINQSSELHEFSESFTSFLVSPDLRPPRA